MKKKKINFNKKKIKIKSVKNNRWKTKIIELKYSYYILFVGPEYSGSFNFNIFTFFLFLFYFYFMKKENLV